MTLEERLDNESRLHQSALAKIEAEMDQVKTQNAKEIDDVEALYNRATPRDNAILKEQLGYCKGDNERLKKENAKYNKRARADYFRTGKQNIVTYGSII